MTYMDVVKRVSEIEAMKGDDEVAHSTEDQLYQDILEAIVAGEIEPTELVNICKMALTTNNIDFARWCA